MAKERLNRTRKRGPPKGTPPHRFKKGEVHNPKGRPKGIKNQITQTRLRIMARTGLLPLDFLTAVYRDQLYDDYQEVFIQDGRTSYFVPTPAALKAGKLPVSVQQRLSAANSAAPYVHKRLPISIDVGDNKQKLITAEQLKKLSVPELTTLLSLVDKVGMPLEFDGYNAATYDENGKEK